MIYWVIGFSAILTVFYLRATNRHPEDIPVLTIVYLVALLALVLFGLVATRAVTI